MGLGDLVALSREYGSDPAWVLAGGGNTSFKDADWLWIKASGTTLATIDANGFVPMSRPALAAIWNHEYPRDVAEREKTALTDLMAARRESATGRPSVETLMHDLFAQAYVVHTHPALINGMTCGRDGMRIALELFGDRAIWIDQLEPGYILARTIRDQLRKYRERHGSECSLLFLANHGVVVAGESPEAVRETQALTMTLCAERVESVLGPGSSRTPEPTFPEPASRVAEVIAALNNLYPDHVVRVGTSSALEPFLRSRALAEPILGVYTPDHLVYAGAEPQFVECATGDDPARRVGEQLQCAPGEEPPKVVLVQGTGAFGIGKNDSAAGSACSLILDSAALATYTRAFGGHRFLHPRLIDFIAGWEVERYRARRSRE